MKWLRKLKSIWLTILLVPSFTGCSQSSESLITEVQINTDFNVIFAPLTVDGDTSWFVIDSGAPRTIIDVDLARKWGLSFGEARTRNQGNYNLMEGDVAGFEFRINDLEVTLEEARTTMIIRNGISSFMGKDFGGILGYNFIRQYVLEVDYENDLLRIHDKDSYRYTGNGEIIDVRITRTRPLIDGEVIESGKQVAATWLIDTGSLMFLSLNGPFVAANEIERHLNTIPSMSVGAGGTGQAVMYKLDAAVLAGHRFESPISAHSSQRISDLFEGVVGGEFLHRYTVILDYERDRVILEPNSNLDKPVRYDLSGMMLRAEGRAYETIQVVFVFDGSPADQIGIETGDVIRTINGEPAADLTLPVIWRRFRENEGDVFQLVIERDGEQFERRLVLTDYFK